MSCDQVLDKLSEKLNSRVLVEEEHGFQKGAQCAPWPQELQKSLAWIGLMSVCMSEQDEASCKTRTLDSPRAFHAIGAYTAYTS